MYTLNYLKKLENNTSHIGYIMSLDMGQTFWFLLDLNYNIISSLNPFSNDSVNYTNKTYDFIPIYKKPYQNLFSDNLLNFLENEEKFLEEPNKWYKYKIINKEDLNYIDISVKKIFQDIILNLK